MNISLHTQVKTRMDRPKRPGPPLRTVSAAVVIAVASGMATAVSAEAAPSARQDSAKTVAGKPSPQDDEWVDNCVVSVMLPVCVP